MDRPPHDYAAAMAFAQQQQQYGFHPQQPQQFPPHGPPFLPQFPFHRHLPPQPQPQTLLPPHLLHLQQQPPPLSAFPPHLPPPSHLLSPFDPSPPPPALPPVDPDLHKRIDKLVEYAAKNGPEFEAMIRDKQQDNPAYSFLFGGEGHAYYRYRLWLSTRGPYAAMPPMLGSSAISPVHGHPGQIVPGPGSLGHQIYQPFFEQQPPPPLQSQAFLGRGDYEPHSKPFKGLSGPLPSDVAAELNSVLGGLTGTKESIKGAKMWFMQRSPFAPALAEALRERVFGIDDSEKQLHIIFLANDILFDSLQRRINPRELDNEALAFKPVLGSMLARVYHNPINKDANQSRLEKIVQFWASKEVYDHETILSFEREMSGGALRYRSITPEGGSIDPEGVAGIPQQMTSQGLNQWQSEKQKLSDSIDMELAEKTGGPASSLFTSSTPQLEAVLSAGAFGQQTNATAFPGSLLTQTSGILTGQPLQVPPASAAGVSDEARPPPYPLFPPGLIPGMVKKMQIGSGVPYSPLSPLDIPTVIPPSTVSPSEILERVSKFFKEIGEINPSEGPMKSSVSSSIHDDYEQDEYERELAVRKGGACIPPPPSLQQVDPETGMYPDGSVERKPGSSSSGRLGLGATADPNEASQYDDVYTSYRKQRSTNYHTSMSARASTR